MFHQSQSQLHRFLNAIGGFTSHRNSYSIGASLVLLPHLVGSSARGVPQGDAVDGDRAAHRAARRVRRPAASRTPSSRRAAWRATACAATWREARRARHAHRALLSPLRDDVGARGRGALVSARAALATSPSCWAWRTCWSARVCTTRCSSSAAAHGAKQFIAYVLGEARRRREDARSGRSSGRASRRDDLRALARADGRVAHARHGVVLAAARAARRAADLGRALARGAARPDRPARRRLRPRLRLDGRPRQPERAEPAAAVAARGPQRRCATSSPCARIADLLLAARRDASTTTARVTPIPTSASCTGRAAIRSTTTRT